MSEQLYDEPAGYCPSMAEELSQTLTHTGRMQPYKTD